MRANKDAISNQKLLVDGVCLWVFGELKEERSDHSGSWWIAAVHTAMSLVEEGVVVREERVADAKHLLTDIGY